MKRKKLVLAVGVVSFIVLIICLSMLLGDKFSSETCGCPNVIESYFVYIFIFLAAIFIGSLVYYLLSLKIETQQNTINKNIRLVMDFLDNDEKKALKEIIKSRGLMLQSELTKKFGKLKTHRLIKRLEQKNMITISSLGKTNEIHLKPELKKELIK